MNIILIGMPGAGKSTQGNLLSKQFRIPYLSTGHIFREIAKEKTKLGRYVKEVITAGHLINDNNTIEIVNEYLSRREYSRGYILDGFPRTVIQAKKFENPIDKVVYLEIPDKEALWRLAYRHDDRDDDTIEAIRRRVEIFHKFTEPVINFYGKEDKLVTLEGTRVIEEVNEEILKSLGKQVIKNKIHDWKQEHKIIIGVVGLSGSGKTEASHYLAEKGLAIVSFSRIVNNYIDKLKLEHTQVLHKKVREEFREKHGMAAMAILSEDEIKDKFKENQTIVIEGLYSWEEYTYLKEKFADVSIYLLAIYADKHLRYKRISERVHRSKLYGEDRDIDELIKLNKGAPIAFADFLVKNNFSLDEFHDKLDMVYRTIYYSLF
ncbi:MAG: nucleoside monophosphate kinase [Candidatus Roizmanbacteria bacterium]